MSKHVSLVLSIVTTLLLVASILWQMTWEGHFSTFLGRTHPLIVHFPIVAILVTILLELAHGRKWVNTRTVSFSYQMTLVSLLAAAFVGQLLITNGDYEGGYIDRHQWLGTALAVVWIWCTHCRHVAMRDPASKLGSISRGLLYLSLLLMLPTGHLGGSITHGPDYLTHPLQQMHLQKRLSQTVAYNNPESMEVFSNLVLPILEAKCNKCHNAANSKGGLNMDNYKALTDGGKSGAPTLVAGDTTQSELLVRVNLPPTHDDFMPPDGRTPLSAAERSLIQWWINNGASPIDTLGNGPQDSLTRLAVRQSLESAATRQMINEENRAEIKLMAPKLARLGEELGLKIIPDRVYDSLLYTISMDIPAQVITDDHLRKLVPYADFFSSASLVSADISDEGLYHLGKMKNVRKLILAKCCLKGQGLTNLIRLPNLEILNLSYSDVSDDHILSILQIPSLREVYLYNTSVSQQLIGTLNKHLKGCQVLNHEGPYY